MVERAAQFAEYTAEGPSCAVAAVTPADEAHVHTYYDLTPWSPSGRYLTSLKLPYEDRHPAPGDAATVCVIDLASRTIRDVYETSAWGFQKGALLLERLSLLQPKLVEHKDAIKSGQRRE